MGIIITIVLLFLVLYQIKNIIQAHNESGKPLIELKKELVGFIITVASLFISLYITLPLPNPIKTNSSTKKETTETPTTTAPTTEPIQDNSVISNDTETLPSEEKQKITDGVISGSITYEEQEIQYAYDAPKTGKYHFDFEFSDVNHPFWFIIQDSTGQNIAEGSASSEGITASLIQEQSYSIFIQEYRGLLDSYAIKINEPTDITIIEGDSFSGSITFTDQQNIYNYLAPITGKYRFTFDISNVNNSFEFIIDNSKKENLADTRSSDGVTVNLVQGEQYTITIKEYYGLLDSYSVYIGIPKEPIQINGNEFGGAITYIDQTDTYYYTAPRNGTYRFDFTTSNVNNPFHFYIWDSKKEKLADRKSRAEGITLDLVKNETYEIQISESEGLLESYSITIGIPNKVKTISSFPIEGKLTFKNQHNIYKYTPSHSGEYTLNFGTDNVNYYYQIIITAANQETILDTLSRNESRTCELTEGETYKIEVIQKEGYPVNYIITLN